jgi:D-aminoacyl-tRNA deacylase
VDKLLSEVVATDIDNLNSYKRAIFLSWHKSKSRIAALTVHATGNFEKKLCMTSAELIGNILRELSTQCNNKKYQIVQEATHHGPMDFPIPAVFVEIGSSKTEWNDLHICEIVVSAVLNAIEKKSNTDNCIAFGGPHYADRFTTRVVKNKFNLGHIVPNYALDKLSQSLIQEMVNKTAEQIDYAVLQKKLKSEHKKKIINLLECSGIKYKKI